MDCSDDDRRQSIDCNRGRQASQHFASIPARLLEQEDGCGCGVIIRLDTRIGMISYQLNLVPEYIRS